MGSRGREWLGRLTGSVPLRLFIVFLVLYGLIAGVSLGRHSLGPHFVYLAESFLHGRLDLVHVPHPPYDLTPYQGRWYVSFPPLPALLMLPLVAIRGLAFSDVAFSVFLGAVDVALAYVALTRLETRQDDRSIIDPPEENVRASRRRRNVWLCVLLGLGTPLVYCAALGSVWYTAHVAAVTCLCLYAIEVLGPNRPILAGLWLGLGFLARPPVVLAFPLAIALGLNRTRRWGGRLRYLLLFGLAAGPSLLAQAAYNWARFDHPLEFGYRLMNSPGALLDRQATWGQFNLHFLPENVYTMLIRPPLISLSPLHVEPDPWGMGLLLTSPALLLALPTLATLIGRPPRPVAGGQRALIGGVWLSVALVALPSLLYFNTGSYQFGYRFALDWLPLGILLVALGQKDQLRWWDQALVIASLLMHGWGTLWMYPNFNGLAWPAQYVALLRRLIQR